MIVEPKGYITVVPSFSKTRPPPTLPLNPMQLLNGKDVLEFAMAGIGSVRFSHPLSYWRRCVVIAKHE